MENYYKFKAFFEKKLEITSYFDIHHKFSIVKKILLSKDNRYMLKLIKPKLKNLSKNGNFSNYFEIYEKSLNTLISTNLIRTNQTLKLDEKNKVLKEMMEEDVRKYFD